MTTDTRLLADRYRVGKHIGRGGMADVYLGTDTRLGRTVAIKILRSSLADDAVFRSRFRHEARAAARMASKFIVRTYDTGEDLFVDSDGVERLSPFIVMEYIEGTLVKDLIAEHKINQVEAVQIAQSVLSALEYSHRAGIIHRDIKPGNVMVSMNGDIKVMDFGVARAVTSTSTTIADSVGILGTAKYFSPEQARGENVDQRSDLYSTGVLLYESLTGRPPFTGDSPASIAYQHVNEEPVPPFIVDPTISESLNRVVLTAMAKDPEARYQNATEFKRDLERVLAGRDSLGHDYVPEEPAPETSAIGITPIDTIGDAGDFANTAPLERIDTRQVKTQHWLFGIAGVAGALVLAIFIWILVADPMHSFHSITTTVSDVSGQKMADGVKTLKSQGFPVSTTTTQDDSVPTGMIIRTDPAAGLTVKPGTAITVYVSAGPKPSTVPSMIGSAQDVAIASLQTAGLQVGEITTANSPDFPKDQVISSSPEAASEVTKNSYVNIVVSTGMVTAPSLIGKSLNDGIAALEDPDVNLQARTQAQYQCDGTANQIVAQSPAAGDVRNDQTVTLTYVVVDPTQCASQTP